MSCYLFLDFWLSGKSDLQSEDEEIAGSFAEDKGESNDVIRDIGRSPALYGSGISLYSQSTTGNITGVFDMSGGAWEYVMGNYNNAESSSGFASSWFTTTSNIKYYNKLLKISMIMFCFCPNECNSLHWWAKQKLY